MERTGRVRSLLFKKVTCPVYAWVRPTQPTTNSRCKFGLQFLSLMPYLQTWRGVPLLENFVWSRDLGQSAEAGGRGGPSWGRLQLVCRLVLGDHLAPGAVTQRPTPSSAREGQAGTYLGMTGLGGDGRPGLGLGRGGHQSRGGGGLPLHGRPRWGARGGPPRGREGLVSSDWDLAGQLRQLSASWPPLLHCVLHGDHWEHISPSALLECREETELTPLHTPSLAPLPPAPSRAQPGTGWGEKLTRAQWQCNVLILRYQHKEVTCHRPASWTSHNPIIISTVHHHQSVRTNTFLFCPAVLTSLSQTCPTLQDRTTDLLCLALQHTKCSSYHHNDDIFSGCFPKYQQDHRDNLLRAWQEGWLISRNVQNFSSKSVRSIQLWPPGREQTSWDLI